MRLNEFAPGGFGFGGGSDGDGFYGNLKPGRYSLSDPEFFGYLNSGAKGLGHRIEDYIADMVHIHDEDSFIFEIENAVEEDVGAVPNFNILAITDLANEDIRQWHIKVD